MARAGAAHATIRRRASISWLATAAQVIALDPIEIVGYAPETDVDKVEPGMPARARLVSGREVDGIVCGHIHHAQIRPIEDIQYFNCGDWVESCTTLVEDYNGQIRLIEWPNEAIGRTELVASEPKVVPLSSAHVS